MSVQHKNDGSCKASDYRILRRANLVQVHSVDCQDVAKMIKNGWAKAGLAHKVSDIVKHEFADFIEEGSMTEAQAIAQLNIKPCAQSLNK